jgi:hypothetical protein
MAALMACFVGPIAYAARTIGPQLASDMDHRVHAISAQDPGASTATASTSSANLDFGSAFQGGQP